MGVLGLSVVLLALVAGGKGQRSSEYVGDACTLNNGESGTCKILPDCPAALANIQKNIHPKICSYNRMTAIVCCETKAAVTSTTATPPRRRRPGTTRQTTTRPILDAKVENRKSYPRDSCTLNNGVSGTCKILHDCPAALVNIRENIHPKICSFDGMTSIVCCEKTAAVTSTTATPPRRRRPGTTRQTTTRPILDAKVEKRKSYLMCEKYASAVFQLVKVVNALMAKPFVVNVTACAASPQTMTIDGHKAEAKEFPHMAVLGYGKADEKDWRCGGSLISERFILTAAHCLVSSGRNVKWALMADLDYERTDDEDQPILAEVIARIPHPNWAQPYNDIALLKLKEDVVFNPSIRPACLNINTTVPVGSRAVATGWSLKGMNSEELSPDLIKVGIEVDEPRRCNTLFRLPSLKKRGFDGKGMICAEDIKGTNHDEGWRDMCQGDSGGPLQTRMSSPFCMYRIIGIASHGSRGCGTSRQSTVYTRVDAYIPWIESIVWPN